MGITLAGAQRMGSAFVCYLDVYYRTIIYGLPRYVLKSGEFSSGVLSDTSDFRAAIMTDPLRYLTESDFSTQFRAEKNSVELAKKRLGEFAEDEDGRLFVVLQIRQEFDSFAAVDGQCIQVGEEIALVNCGEPHVPPIRDSTDLINTTMTATKMEFDITDGFHKYLDEPIYVTDEGEYVHWFDPQLSASGSVTHPIGAEELRAKTDGAGRLVGKINRALTANAGPSDMSAERRQNIANRLAALIDALQLDPTKDDAYRRLWYLQLELPPESWRVG